MDQLVLSFIVPVYNRPKEVKELLHSFTELDGDLKYEIVIIEDGSTVTSEDVVNEFKSKLNISYYSKPNSGPGDSRNYGMQKAKGNYFIILDSDVLLPSHYLTEVYNFLSNSYVDCFGGPDAAHPSFNNLQKAINFAMTSFLTTGGIRGGQRQVDDFQPRSFNMGLSKDAFLDTKGFSDIHPGEDPDLSLRLKAKGYKTALIPNAYVYHKRRITWSKFFSQVEKFGLARPILNLWHPQSKSIVFWFPTVFMLGLILSLILLLFSIPYLFWCYITYFGLALVLAAWANKSLTVGFLALIAVFVQFLGYGWGFLKSTLAISILKKEPKKVFPGLFFK
jgi:GT2 family glycosyltransferase